MKKLILILSLTCAMALLLWGTSSADDDSNKTVNATITPLVISLSIDNSSLSYGIQQANAGEVVANPVSITITNTGSVAEDFKITGADSTSGQWTLGSTAGINQFVHLFSTSNSSFTNLTTSPQAVQSNVSPTTGNFQLYMRLVVPTTITQTAVQTLPIKITALQH